MLKYPDLVVIFGPDFDRYSRVKGPTDFLKKFRVSATVSGCETVGIEQVLN